jgi:hypothetical protein
MNFLKNLIQLENLVPDLEEQSLHSACLQKRLSTISKAVLPAKPSRLRPKRQKYHLEYGQVVG